MSPNKKTFFFNLLIIAIFLCGLFLKDFLYPSNATGPKTNNPQNAASQKRTDSIPEESAVVAAIAVPKNTASNISDDDEKLLRSYGTCSSILKAIIYMLNANGAQDNLAQNISTHQATIYTILMLNVVRKYPESLHDEAFKVANKFLEEEIINKSLTGPQLTAFKSQNGGCFLDDVSKAKIDEIMINEKESYDKFFKKFKKL